MTLASLFRLTFALLLGAVIAQGPLAAEPDRGAAIAAATEQAEQWLQAMDAHRWDDGWKQSAAVVREGRTQEDWVRDFGTPREALGKPVMREVKRADYSTAVRGAPEGEYVTAVFLTQFSNTPPATETVLLVLERGQWRVGGYDVAAAPDAPPASPPTPAPASQPQPQAK